MTVEVRHYSADQLSDIRKFILDIHTEVRHRDFGLSGPFYDVEQFNNRLNMYATRPGWTAVIGFEEDEAAGFCFGVALASENRWWSPMINELPAEYTRENGRRTVALQEIVVRKQWRGRGVAWQIHQEWLHQRSEERVTLLVNPTAGNGSVQAVYEAWGYRKIGDQQPFPESPVFACMMRPRLISAFPG